MIFSNFCISSTDSGLLLSFFAFRGTPKTRFSNFSSFGTPRKLVFWNFEASGLPDGSFSQKTTRRDIPKHCFSEFHPFGMPRSTIFPIFRGFPMSWRADDAILYLMKYKPPQSKSASIAHRQTDCRLPICFYQTAIKNSISAVANLQKVAYSYWRLSKRSKQVNCNISWIS